MEFGEIVKALRTKKGLTLEDVAKRIGVNNATVSRWETGEIKNIKSDKIGLLADVLGTSTEYLLGRTDNPEAITVNNNLMPIYIGNDCIVSNQVADIAAAEHMREMASKRILDVIEEMCYSYMSTPSGAQIPIIRESDVNIVISFIKRNSDLLKAQMLAAKNK